MFVLTLVQLVALLPFASAGPFPCKFNVCWSGLMEALKRSAADETTADQSPKRALGRRDAQYGYGSYSPAVSSSSQLKTGTAGAVMSSTSSLPGTSIPSSSSYSSSEVTTLVITIQTTEVTTVAIPTTSSSIASTLANRTGGGMSSLSSQTSSNSGSFLHISNTSSSIVGPTAVTTIVTTDVITDTIVIFVTEPYPSPSTSSLSMFPTTTNSSFSESGLPRTGGYSLSSSSPSSFPSPSSSAGYINMTSSSVMNQSGSSGTVAQSYMTAGGTNTTTNTSSYLSSVVIGPTGGTSYVPLTTLTPPGSTPSMSQTNAPRNGSVAQSSPPCTQSTYHPNSTFYGATGATTSRLSTTTPPYPSYPLYTASMNASTAVASAVSLNKTYTAPSINGTTTVVVTIPITIVTTETLPSSSSPATYGNSTMPSSMIRPNTTTSASISETGLPRTGGFSSASAGAGASSSSTPPSNRSSSIYLCQSPFCTPTASFSSLPTNASASNTTAAPTNTTSPASTLTPNNTTTIITTIQITETIYTTVTDPSFPSPISSAINGPGGNYTTPTSSTKPAITSSTAASVPYPFYTVPSASSSAPSSVVENRMAGNSTAAYAYLAASSTEASPSPTPYQWPGYGPPNGYDDGHKAVADGGWWGWGGRGGK